MIEFNYPLVTEFMFKRLFVPYLFFQAIFVLYYQVFYEGFYVMRADKDAYVLPDYALTAENLAILLESFKIDEDVLKQIPLNALLAGL